MTSSSYSFRDTDRAGQRLLLVAKVFKTEMRKFLSSSAPKRPKLAVDLGCGPGHTTCLLGEVAQRKILIGVDISERFLQIVRASEKG